MSTDGNGKGMRLVQIAFSVLDLDATPAWYRDVLGYLPSGGMDGAGDPVSAAMQGLPSLHCDMRWLVDAGDLFQLEFFRFHDPVPVAGERAPDDLGYAMVGVHVTDFDATLDQVRSAGSRIGPVLGRPGARRACTQDPEGAWVELWERHPARHRAAARDAPVSTCSVRVVVPDLTRARAYFEQVIGLRPGGEALHEPGDQRLWGADPADAATCVLDGGGVLVELVQFRSPAGRPRPAGYRICDQGILNIAFGSRDMTAYDATVGRLDRAGHRTHGEMWIGPAVARYTVAEDDLSVELLAIPDPGVERQFGFDAAQAPDIGGV